jgi:hypothetical protein
MREIRATWSVFAAWAIASKDQIEI